MRAAIIPHRGNKYRAQAQIVDGEFFASKKEARRWYELKLEERAGQITDLERQVRFALDVNGVPVCQYVADFKYERLGKSVVEDAKGVRTPEYKIKAKLMKACLGITILET